MEAFLETRAGRWLVEAGIALLAAGVTAARGWSALPPWPVAAWAVAAVACLGLLARTVLPLPVLAVTVLADVAGAQLWGADGVASAAAFVAAATAASRAGVTMRSIPLIVAFTCGETFLVGHPFGLGKVAVCALCQLVIAAGLRVGVRRDRATRTREHVERLRERAAAAAREVDLAMRSAAAEERLRIARDVHDVLAHTLSVIVVQATAADDAFERTPARARAAVESIGDVARKALGDLRALLGSLHDPGAEDASAPPASPEADLSGLQTLVRHVRAAGLEVSLDVGDDVPRLPPAIALTVFRIIQEALTNTLRHAHARTALVTVRVEPATPPTGAESGVVADHRPAGPGDEAPHPLRQTPPAASRTPQQAAAPGEALPAGLAASRALVVSIADDGWGTGPGHRDSAWPGSGRGLTGMRSRVVDLGGKLSTGDRYPHGFQVDAWLPLADAAPRQS